MTSMRFSGFCARVKGSRLSVETGALAAMVCLTALSAPTPATAKTPATVPATNPDYVETFSRFDEGFMHGQGASFDDNSTGTLAWLQSYLMLGYMQQYRTTQDTRWLDKIVTQFDRVLSRRDDRAGKIDVYTSTSLKGWGAANYDKAGWHVFTVHTGMLCQGPVEFVREVTETPGLQENYGVPASRFLFEIEDMVAEADLNWKDDDSTTAGEGYYTDPALGILPLNMSTAMGSVLLELYAITGNERYRDNVQKLALFLKNSMHPAKNETLNWAYWPKKSSDKIGVGEDISHAALNVDFAARCTSAGIVFKKDDIVKIANTWLQVVRRPDGTWAKCVDGSGEGTSAYIPQGAGRWLSIMPHLPAPLAREFYQDVARAFTGKEIKMPSSGLGIANLAYYRRQLQ